MNRTANFLLLRGFQRAFASTVVALGALFCGLSPREAAAQNAVSMSQVQTVFARRSSGNAFFNQRLRAELKARGLRFVRTPRGADAFLDSKGDFTGGGFRGEMVFIGRNGRVLLRESVVRPQKSSVMAYRSLARKYRGPRR